MKFIITPWLFILLGLALIVGVAFGVWHLVAALMAWIMAQPSQIAAAMIAFAGAVIPGVAVVVISQRHAKSREIAESHRPRKVELYNEFITQMVGLLHDHTDDKTPSPATTKKRDEFFLKFTADVMLWGSPSVLRYYSAFREAGQQSEPDAKMVLLSMDDLLRAMRKDLGLGNGTLGRGDLMKLLLTDPNKLD